MKHKSQYPEQTTSVVGSIFAKVLYSSEETMVILGISRPTLYREIRKGELKLRKIGRRSVFHADDIVAYVNALPYSGGALKKVAS